MAPSRTRLRLSLAVAVTIVAVAACTRSETVPTSSTTVPVPPSTTVATSPPTTQLLPPVESAADLWSALEDLGYRVTEGLWSGSCHNGEHTNIEADGHGLSVWEYPTVLHSQVAAAMYRDCPHRTPGIFDDTVVENFNWDSGRMLVHYHRPDEQPDDLSDHLTGLLGTPLTRQDSYWYWLRTETGPLLRWKPIQVEGFGTQVVEMSVPDNEPALVYIDPRGGGAFSLTTLDEEMNPIETLVETEGSYFGTRPVNFGRGPPVAYAAIEAGDQGKFEITPLEDAIPFVDGVAIGFGDDVAMLDRYGGQDLIPGVSTPERYVQIVHQADGPFRVTAHTSGDRHTLVFGEGLFSVEVLVPTGTIAIGGPSDGTVGYQPWHNPIASPAMTRSG